MAKVLSMSMVARTLITVSAVKTPVIATSTLSCPVLDRRRSAQHECRRWSTFGGTCYRTVRVSVTAKDDFPSRSTELVELPRTAADIATDFYELVNQRNYVKVSNLFAEDCVYEDFTFPEPVKGREEILKFFEKVMASFGPELIFVIDDITRDDPNAVGVIWHLEWRGKTFPYSRGCSFYRCEVNSSGQRQIKFARDIVEPATKPGDLAMGAIKLVTSLFEKFPNLIDRI